MLLMVLIIIIGWQTKSDNKKRNIQKDNSLIVNTKNAQKVILKYGNSLDIELNYIGLNHLLSMYYYTNKTNNWFLVFDEEAFPAAIILPQNQSNMTSRATRFYPQNGAIREISQQTNNNYNGPYYLFDYNGYLIVSGFYKEGYESGIWRHYDKEGKVIESVNANIDKSNIRKRFGIEE